MNVHERRQGSIFLVPTTSTVQNYHSPLFCPIKLGPAHRDKLQRCILRRSPVYRSPRHKCQRRSSNTFPIYATSRVAFFQNVFVPPVTSWVQPTGLIIRPRRRSDRSLTLYSFVLRLDGVLSASWRVPSLHPSPQRKGPYLFIKVSSPLKLNIHL